MYLYRFNGRQQKLTLGHYPKQSFGEARRARQNARDFLEQSIESGEKKQIRKLNLFSDVAKGWFSAYKVNRADETISIFGQMDMEDIKRLQLVELVKGNTVFEASKDRVKHKGWRELLQFVLCS